MSVPDPLRSSAPDPASREAVVRPLARAAQRACDRPGCPSPARATLAFRYGTREMWLERLAEEPRPEAYDLCGPHAARTQPPHGWELRDRRPREERVEQAPEACAQELGSDRTVAVLAAALHRDPEPPRPASGADDDPGPAADGARAAPLSSPPRGESDAEPAAGAADVPDGVPRRPPGHEGTASPVLEPPSAPRPVPAARDREGEGGRGRDDGVARDW